MDEGPILLSVVLPDGEELTVRCDSVRFTVPDSADGRIQGGSVGIRKGHASALMAVASGAVTAFPKPFRPLRQDGVFRFGPTTR